MMGVGFAVQRKLGFDIKSLTRLNFWVFVPAFLFVKFVGSKLSAGEFIAIIIHFVILFTTMGVLSWQVAKWCGYGDRLRRALTASVLFYNSGNYGVPVAKFAFLGAGDSVQAFVIILQNFTNFTIGLGLHAGGGGGMSKRDQLSAIFKLPMVYAFVAAIIWRTFQLPIPGPFDDALKYLADGLVPIALVTLGAQMATLESYRFTPAMGVTLFLRLVLAPIIGCAIVLAMGLHGILAQALIVSTSFPTAVNSALLAIEYDNEPEYAAAIVFYSTVISTLTVSLVIYLAKTYVK